MSYLLAQGLGMSGIVSILFAGISMSHYTFYNLSPRAQMLTTEIFEVISSIAEAFVFVAQGLALFAFSLDYDWGFIIATIVRCVAWFSCCAG
jgi:NhaP-type Na+/H+ or K+/H+ antiporter